MSTLDLSLKASTAKAARIRKGFWARFMKALHDSRMREARVVIARYRHLLPSELDCAALKLDERSERQLPFVH